MKPVFCSYWTEGTGYEAEAVELVKTLDRFGLEHDVAAVPNRGAWVLNTQQKPAYLLRMREKYPGRELVWLDADARVMRPPVLFDALDCDLAVNLFRGKQLATGTVYFGPGPAAGELLTAWQAECDAHRDTDDQTCLAKVFANSYWQRIACGKPRIAYLPPSYMAIFDMAECAADEIVILHTQASRRYRNAV